MKKGLVILMVASFALIGMVSYAASPLMWGIPDVIIGDAEDKAAVTDNYFVFSDAFTFADYFYWKESDLSELNTGGLKWLYPDAESPDTIAINNSTPSAVAAIDAGAPTASFRNILITPLGNETGPYTIGAASTDPIVVTLAVDNFLVSDTQNVTVYTVDEGNDALTNEYYRQEGSTVAMSADPGWDYIGYNADPGAGFEFGLSPATYSYNGTSDALILETTGSDNNFGAWQMPANQIPWEDGMVYIFTANIFTRPTGYPEGANWKAYAPRVRLRCNTGNETVNVEWELQSGQQGQHVVTSSPVNTSAEVFVFDPRDHSAFAGFGLDYLYFSFDLIDYVAAGRYFSGQLDDEGLVGLTNLVVETLPLKMIAEPAGAAIEVYPSNSTGTFAAEAGEYLSVENGFGGNAIQADVDSGSGAFKLENNNVLQGVSLWQTNQNVVPVVGRTDKWFMYQFWATANNQDAYWMRFRVFLQDGSRSTNYSIRKPADVDDLGYQFPDNPLIPRPYNAFYCPPQGQLESGQLGFGFDHIDFSPDYGNSTLMLHSVSAYAFDPPTPAP